MILREILSALLELVASLVGVEGVAIGALATATVGLYYLREVAGVFVLLARYARVLSIIGAVLLLVLVGGDAIGALELGGVVSAFGQLAKQLGKVIP